MSAPAPPARWSLLRRIGVGLVAAFVLYLAVGVWAVPAVVESQLVSLIEEQTGVTPSLRGVRFDPLRLRLGVDGFALADPVDRREAIAFETLEIDARLVGFLSADVALDEVLLRGPRIAASLDPTGELNLVRLWSARAESAKADGGARAGEGAAPDPDADPPADAATASGAETAAAPLIVDVGRIRIEAGSLDFVDRTQSPPFETRVEALNLDLEDLSTRTDVMSPYSLQLRIGEATELRWQGDLGLDPLRSEGTVSLADFDLRLPWDFLSERVRFEVESGGLDVELRYAAELAAGIELAIDEGRIFVRNLVVRDPAAESAIVSLPELSLDPIEARVTDGALRSLAIGEVSARDGRIVSWIEPDGSIHLAELFQPIVSEETAEDGLEAATGAQSNAADPDPEGSAPEIRVDRVALGGFELDFADRSAARPVPVTLSPLSLTASGFRSTPGAEITIDLSTGVGEEASLEVRGPLVVDPLAATFAIEAESIALGPFQPYLEEIARIDVPSGTLAGNLEVDLRDPAEGALTFRARGRLQVDDLVTIDRRLKRRFVEWRQLRVEALDLARSGVSIGEIALAGASAHVIRDDRGRSNIEAIFGAEEGGRSEASARPESAPPGASDAPSAESTPGFAVRIDKLSLDGIGAVFDDLSTDPDVRISLDALRGTIEGLSSDRLARAKVDLAGRIDEVAPIRIDGQIDPLSSDAFTDLRISVEGVSLPTFTPYAARYVGYAIDRGNLGLELAYRISQRSLEAENHISLVQFAFGEKVESEEATSLPVPLAVALMRDPSGDIEVDLPIRGNLDDPSFDLFGLLRKAVVNLVTRVATSPFAAVAGIVGASGEELSRVTFAPGSDRLSETEEAEIANLAAALARRPSLHLEIRGRADPDVDGPELRAARVDESVRLAAYQSLSRRERERVGSPEALELDLEMRLEMLKRLYRDWIGGDPDALVSASGSTGTEADRRTQRAAALGAALAARVELLDTDWRSLAHARAAAVQGALVATQQIDPDRVFLMDVEVAATGGTDAVATELALTAK